VVEVRDSRSESASGLPVDKSDESFAQEYSLCLATIAWCLRIPAQSDHRFWN